MLGPLGVLLRSVRLVSLVSRLGQDATRHVGRGCGVTRRLSCVRAAGHSSAATSSVGRRRDAEGLQVPKGANSSIKVNAEIIKAGQARDVEGMLAIVRNAMGKEGSEGLKFDMINCSTWLNRWSKLDALRLKGQPPAELLWVLARTRYLLIHESGGVSSQAVGNVANAVCKLEYVWADGKPAHKALLEELAGLVLRREKGMTDFDAQHISNFLNAFGKVELSPGLKVLLMVSRECTRRGLTGFKAQDISNIINGFARLGVHPGKKLLDMVSQECVRRKLDGFEAQAISNIINGFAKLEKHPGKKLLMMVSQECVKRNLDGFKPQAISNIMNGFARLGEHPGKQLLVMMSQECVRRKLDGFNALDIAHIMNGFAKLEEHPGKQLLGMVSQECVRRKLEGYTAQDISNIVNAYAAFAHHPGEPLLCLVVRRCQDTCFREFNGQELSNVLHGLATLGHVPGEAWLAGFYARCEEVGWEALGSQELTQILWASAVLEKGINGGLLRAVSARLRDWLAGLSQEGEGLDYQQALQTCRAWQQLLFVASREDRASMQDLSEAAEALWKEVKHMDRKPTISMLQKSVHKALRDLGHALEEEVMLADGLLSIDMMVTLRCGAKVGVEVDGPVHFFSNDQDVPTGTTRLKPAHAG